MAAKKSTDVALASDVPLQSDKTEETVLKIPFMRKARPYLILAPALLLTIGILYPFVTSIYYSFTDYSFKYENFSFIGLDNWTAMFKDAAFWNSAWVTLKYAVCSTGVEMILGILVALMLNQENWLSRALRMVLIFPLMIAPVIATLIWQLMTNDSVGVISHWLKSVGIKNFLWGASPSTAMFSVVLIDVWVYTPFVIILVLAGLRSLPKAPFESAMIDGGSAWFTFRTLTLPMIMPLLLIALLFRLMTSLQEFSIIFALTRGGPGDTLMSLPLTAYTEAFTYKELGSALPYMLILWAFVYFVSHYMIKYWSRTQKRASGN